MKKASSTVIHIPSAENGLMTSQRGHQTALQKTLRILRLKRVLDRVGISRAQLYAQMKKGSFPKNFSLSGPGGRSVGWLEQEIDDWVTRRAEQQIKVEVQ